MRFFYFMVAMLACFAVHYPALACECDEMTEARSREILAEAALVFEGRVMAMSQPEMPEENFSYELTGPIAQSPFYAQLSIKPLEIYSGQTDETRIEAFIDTVSACGYIIREGDVADFVLVMEDDVLVQADHCNMPLPAHWDALRQGKLKEEE